jgi:hypothetical protein
LQNSATSMFSSTTQATRMSTFDINFLAVYSFMHFVIPNFRLERTVTSWTSRRSGTWWFPPEAPYLMRRRRRFPLWSKVLLPNSLIVASRQLRPSEANIVFPRIQHEFPESFIRRRLEEMIFTNGRTRICELLFLNSDSNCKSVPFCVSLLNGRSHPDGSRPTKGTRDISGWPEFASNAPWFWNTGWLKSNENVPWFWFVHEIVELQLCHFWKYSP